MTEDEAKSMRCCGPDGVGVYREVPTNEPPPAMLTRMERFCIGSACMAWRWFGTHVNDPDGGPDLVFSRRTHGCCGLAGPWFPTREDQP